MIYFIFIFGLFTVVAGRLLFGKWYNHITLYGAVWSFTLILFEMRFINYYPLESETWILIVGGWLSFLFGSVTIFFARYAFGKRSVDKCSEVSRLNIDSERTSRLLRSFIWIFTLGSLASAIYYWSALLSKFGSVENALIMGNILYSLRTSGTLEGGIPYLGALALAGSLLGGIYVGLAGKMKIIALLPFAVIILSSIATMGRAFLMISGILFLSGLFFVRGYSWESHPTSGWSKIKKGFIVALILLIVGGSIEFVRSHRGVIENLPGATQSLNRLRGSSIITPSVYLYITVHYGVLNQYLKDDAEHVPFGTHTFAPFWRALSKIGFDTYVPEYQVSYLTPVGSNTGTYLRELHADFGILGVLIFPFLMGLITTYILIKQSYRWTWTKLVLLAHIYVVVIMSFMLGATRWGYWLTSLIASLFLSIVMDRQYLNIHKLKSDELRVERNEF